MIRSIRIQHYYISIFFIIAAGLLIRCYQVHSRTLSFWDEGIFLMGCRFLRWRLFGGGVTAIQWLGFPIIPPDPSAYQGYPVYLQKPFHVVLLTLTSFLMGVRDATGYIHSIVYGMGTVFLGSEISRRIYGLWAGLITALWLVIQPYHVFYSRLALHETDSMFLLVLAVFLYFQSTGGSGKRMVFWVGVSAAAAMGASYRLFTIFPILIGLEIYETIRHRSGLRRVMTRLAWLGCGAAVVLLFLEAVHRFSFYPSYTWSEPASYLAILKKKFISSESKLDAAHPFFYLGMYRQFDGLLPTIVLFLGLIHAWFSRNMSRKVVVLFLLPFIMYSFTMTRLARTPTSLLPWGAIMIGGFLSSWQEHRGTTRKISIIALPALLFLSCLEMITHLPPIYQARSGYSRVFDYLKKQQAAFHLSTMKPVSGFYLGAGAVDDPASTLDGIHQQVLQTGVRYLCVDWEKYVWYRPGVMKIEETVLPVFAAENPVVGFFATLHENYLPDDVVELRRRDPTLGYIKVYDLHDAFIQMGYPMPLIPPRSGVHNTEWTESSDKGMPGS